jgi:hypothetical protein
MDPNIWSNLTDELVNMICCDAVKSKGVHPFAEEVKTLMELQEIIDAYMNLYDGEEALDWLSNDLEDQFFNPKAVLEGWGVHRKWRSLTPSQRRDFFIVFV